MNTDEFDYFLPEERIAQTPLEDRTASRLLVLDKESGEYKDDTFINIKDYLKEGDCLVLNNTRVIPARLYGKKKENVEKALFLCLELDGKLKGARSDVWVVTEIYILQMTRILGGAV